MSMTRAWAAKAVDNERLQASQSYIAGELARRRAVGGAYGANPNNPKQKRRLLAGVMAAEKKAYWEIDSRTKGDLNRGAAQTRMEMTREFAHSKTWGYRSNADELDRLQSRYRGVSDSELRSEMKDIRKRLRHGERSLDSETSNWHYANAAGAYAAIIGLLGGLFFLATNITGNVTGMTATNSSSVGIILLAIGLIAGYFWVKRR